MEMFAKATREKFRFGTQGWSTEFLWTAGESNLIQLEDSLTAELDTFGKKSRRTTNNSAQREVVQCKLNIVSFILDTLIEESKQRSNKAETAKQKEQLELILMTKKVKELEDLSVEELEKKIAAL